MTEMTRCVVTCGRSLNDKNKILLTSFFVNDIPKILNQERNKDKSQNKTARMYADISSFLEGVCKDIKTMYPSTSNDYQYVHRLFTRLMDSPSTSLQQPTEPSSCNSAGSDSQE